MDSREDYIQYNGDGSLIPKHKYIRGPDGATLVPWSRGRCLLWDATCTDTLARSYIDRSAVEPGAAAALAETNKSVKYAALSVAHEFVPVAIETLGTWDPPHL